MKKPLLFSFLAVLALVPTAKALAFDPNYIISDTEMKDSSAMTLGQIQAFLTQGALGSYIVNDIDGARRTAAEVIYRASQNIGINPKVLLVLIQKEQSLVTDTNPTFKQLNWATGYGVCDTCDLNSPTLSARFSGFGKQINSAALQFIDGYMNDITEFGKTASKYGPGLAISIDGTTVTPENAATAALYAYTPHLHGNENFAALWQTWFGRNYPNGTLLQVSGEPGVWLVQNGERRAITSEAALNSRFNKNLIVAISKNSLEQFPVGRSISLPNYTLVQDPEGNISLLVDDALRRIDNMDTFKAIGFSTDELVSITDAEEAQYDVGDPITSATTDPQGKLLQLKTTGAVFYVENGKRHAIVDKAILSANFPNAPLYPANPVDVEQYRESTPEKLPDGYLVKSPDDPAVYVIADGERRAIPSEAVFTSFGYQWKNVVTVPDEVLQLHPLGEPLQAAAADSVQAASGG